MRTTLAGLSHLVDGQGRRYAAGRCYEIYAAAPPTSSGARQRTGNFRNSSRERSFCFRRCKIPPHDAPSLCRRRLASSFAVKSDGKAIDSTFEVLSIDIWTAVAMCRKPGLSCSTQRRRARLRHSNLSTFVPAEDRDPPL